MKRILIFIGLKIVEICGIVFIPYQVHKFSCRWKWYRDEVLNEPIFFHWFVGLMLILVASFVGWGIIELIKANWKTAGELSK